MSLNESLEDFAIREGLTATMINVSICQFILQILTKYSICRLPQTFKFCVLGTLGLPLKDLVGLQDRRETDQTRK